MTDMEVEDLEKEPSRPLEDASKATQAASGATTEAGAKASKRRLRWSPQWIPALCDAISRKNAREHRHLAKRMLRHICGSRAAYHSTRDAHLFNCELQGLAQATARWMPALLAERKGPAASLEILGQSRDDMDYETQVMFHTSLRTLARSARSRHQNWQTFCARTDDLPAVPIRLLFELSVELKAPSLKV